MQEIYRKRGRALADTFLKYETEYMLGFLEAEQAQPLTRGLGEMAQCDAGEAVRMILSVDEQLAKTFLKVEGTACYGAFCNAVEETLREGGRIILSGCGATGRLALNLEATWRRALSKMDNPLAKHLENQVITIMTGGDYAVIKSVECFEDFDRLGAQQVELLDVDSKDLLIGITATAETTSILGTAFAAAQRGAQIWMVVCSDPQQAAARLLRAKRVFTHPNVDALYMPCGAMAVTGSTRMQSSSIEQLACGSAMQRAMLRILGLAEPADWGRGFQSVIQALLSPEAIAFMGQYAKLEADTYGAGGLVTYYADEYLLDILADTTERSPTFMVPPFLPAGKTGAPSWAFAKHPTLNTVDAWHACFMHTPRCIDWTIEDYHAMQIPIEVAPEISREDLYRFPIGCERNAVREGKGRMATWVGERLADASSVPVGYETRKAITLEQLGIGLDTTPMKLYFHLAMKIVLNTISTVSMGCMGRLTSNFMTFMDMSNKKLVDRSTRLIAQECDISYEDALYELYCTKAQLDVAHETASPVQRTIQRVRESLI